MQPVTGNEEEQILMRKPAFFVKRFIISANWRLSTAGEKALKFFSRKPIVDHWKQ
jgi:hypothetical protein